MHGLTEPGLEQTDNNPAKCEVEMIDGSGGSQRSAETKLVGLKIGGFDHFLDPNHPLDPYHVMPSAWVFGMVGIIMCLSCNVSLVFLKLVTK